MRQVVLDTETTGLEPEEGHRVIEVGALELIDRRLTGKHFHCYLNPDRPVARGAAEVHGLTDEFLSDKPRFSDIADELVAFLRDAELVIHNAPFDVGFLDSEFRRLPNPRRTEDFACVLDTLVLARELHPGQRNSLDALCRRYEVDNSNRTLHGALLDAELLADVYLLMTGGQVALGLELRSGTSSATAPDVPGFDPSRLVRRPPNSEEMTAHRALVERIENVAGAAGCLWRELDDDVAD